MKKNIICIILLSMVCMMAGCQSKEEKAYKTLDKVEELTAEGKYEDALKKLDKIREVIDVENAEEEVLLERKYAKIPEGDLTEKVQADIELVGATDEELIGFDISSVTEIITDRDTIEDYLDSYFYGEWYKEGKNKSIEFNEWELDEEQYGVSYMFRVSNEYIDNIVVKMYEMGKADKVFCVMLGSYYLGQLLDGYASYYEISVVDSKGNVESYRDLSKDDFEELEAEIAMVSDMAMIEEEIVETTHDSFLERKKGEFSNILDTAFVSSEIVDYSVTYSEGSIICSMKVKYYENKYSALWGGNSQIFYVTGTFNYNKSTGTASLVSLNVE